MRRLNGLDWLSLILTIVGAINWGLIGLFDYNLVGSLFGIDSGITRVIYTLVGLSGLYLAGASSRFVRDERDQQEHGGRSGYEGRPMGANR